MGIELSNATATLRRWTVRAAVGLASFIVVTLATLWLTAYSDEHHWFAHPSDQLAVAMKLLAAIIGSAWFHWSGGATFGFTAGMWVDAFLRKKASTEQSPEDQLSRVREFGKSMVDLSQEILRFYSDRAREWETRYPATKTKADFNMTTYFNEERNYREYTKRLCLEKFNSKVLAMIALLQKSGIPLAPRILWIAEHSPEAIPKYFGVIGQLLADGNLESAAELGNNREFMEQISR
jgi:hypothetical protein